MNTNEIPEIRLDPHELGLPTLAVLEKMALETADAQLARLVTAFQALRVADLAVWGVCRNPDPDEGEQKIFLNLRAQSAPDASPAWHFEGKVCVRRGLTTKLKERLWFDLSSMSGVKVVIVDAHGPVCFTGIEYPLAQTYADGPGLWLAASGELEPGVWWPATASHHVAFVDWLTRAVSAAGDHVPVVDDPTIRDAELADQRLLAAAFFSATEKWPGPSRPSTAWGTDGPNRTLARGPNGVWIEEHPQYVPLGPSKDRMPPALHYRALYPGADHLHGLYFSDDAWAHEAEVSLDEAPELVRAWLHDSGVVLAELLGTTLEDVLAFHSEVWRRLRVDSATGRFKSAELEIQGTVLGGHWVVECVGRGSTPGCARLTARDSWPMLFSRYTAERMYPACFLISGEFRCARCGESKPLPASRAPHVLEAHIASPSDPGTHD